ncbi:Ig-like domain-containing protein [Mesoterricola silvestris]|nr:Ig-like domain-containing protein [Mesoterricola silvestris]
MICAFLLALAGCSSRQEPVPNPAPDVSTNAAAFDPSTGDVPLPNILATAAAADPLATLTAGTSMDPAKAMAYINKYEVGGTNAVAGVNAPIYLHFSYPLQASTVTAANIKVFQLTPDAGGTENNALGFTDVTGMFTFKYPAGGTDLWLFPSFPLTPGTRYLYVVTSRVKDAATGGAVIPSVYFNYLKSTAPLTGATAALEPIRANVTSGPAILLSGYAKVMDDLIAAAGTTTITSRGDIALMGRFITSGAGFIAPNPASPSTLIPVESALRAFAAGAALGGLPGKTWDNSVTVTATFTKGNANPLLDVGAFWQGATGAPASSVPATLGTVVLGTLKTAFLNIDPVLARANAASMDLGAVTGAFNPASGVVQPFRGAGGALTGYYHVAADIPFIYIAPDAAAPAGGYPVVLYQHGITSQKETVVGLAQTLTGGGFAALAVDLPLHGALAPPALAIAAGDSAAVKAQKQAGWGQAFMAVGAPLATRSNIQQAAFDLHRLELVLATHGFDVLGAKAPATTKAKFAGISLGSIVGAYYLAGNTTLSTTAPAPYTQATLAGDMKGFLSVPGARTAYLIQASPAFGATVDAGLAQAGIAKGSVTYNAFFQATQTVVDTADPATMTTPLAAGLPSRLSGRVLIQEATSATFDAGGNPTDGDLVITNPFTRYLGNALGGRAVLGTPAAAAVAPGFFQLGYGTADRIPSTFLYTLNGTAPAPKTQPAAQLPTDTTPVEGYFQFDQAGIGHGGLLDPTHPANAALMQKQMLFFLGVTGTSIALDPTQTAAGLVQGISADVQVPAIWTILGH